jgi:hypothetical protein
MRGEKMDGKGGGPGVMARVMPGRSALCNNSVTRRAARQARGWARGVDLHQARGIDGGVGLRGRQRGMAQQLLDRAQVAPGVQQMRGEAVAQRVRRGAGGQAELQARLRSITGRWRGFSGPPRMPRNSGAPAASSCGQSAA